LKNLIKKFHFILFSLILIHCSKDSSSDPISPNLNSIVTRPHELELYKSKTFNLFAVSDNGEDISFSLNTNPSNGVATITGKELTYTPNSNFQGLETFNVTATTSSSTATFPVSIDVFENPYKDFEITDVKQITITYENSELDGSYADYTCKFNGVERQFSIFTPNGLLKYKSNEVPLFMYFHGSNGTSLPSSYLEILRVIQKYNKKLIYVRPQGLPGTAEEGEATGGMTNARGFNYYFPGWREQNDDVGFVNALINYLHDNYSISHKKIIIGGFSTGGSFVPVMGSENELIDGVIQGAGMMHTYYNYSYEQPIKYHAWKGTADGYHPYGYDENYPYFWGINEALEMFSEIKSCQENTSTTLPDLNNDGSLVEKFNIQCYDGSSFNGYKMWWWGHIEPWGLDSPYANYYADINIFQILSEIIE